MFVLGINSILKLYFLYILRIIRISRLNKVFIAGNLKFMREWFVK